MIDIGANLSNKQFDHDLNEVINNSIENNIKIIILTSTDKDTFLKNLKIIENYKNLDIILKTTYGLHPHKANELNEFKINFEKYINNENIISLGEFGLDYFRLLSNKTEQINTMEFFIEKSFNLNLPLFLHEREAFNDFYSLVKNVKSKSVVHCFTGTKDNLKKYLDLGFYIGLTGWISDKRRNSDLLEAVKYIPIDKLMIETDCPYLSPKNIIKNIKRNEPKFLNHIVKNISEIKNISEEDVVYNTVKNSIDFFSLKCYTNNKKIGI